MYTLKLSDQERNELDMLAIKFKFNTLSDFLRHAGKMYAHTKDLGESIHATKQLLLILSNPEYAEIQAENLVIDLVRKSYPESHFMTDEQLKRNYAIPYSIGMTAFNYCIEILKKKGN